MYNIRMLKVILHMQVGLRPQTDDQFGGFVPGVWDEYVLRVCLTIASKYRIKNPDEIIHGALKPADYSAHILMRRTDALLAASNSNNV